MFYRYGADVLIFEGIMAFHNPKVLEMMDMKVRLGNLARIVFLICSFRFLWTQIQMCA